MNPPLCKNSSRLGLTLIELLVVMTIISVLAGIALGMMRRGDGTLVIEANAKLLRSSLRLARNSAKDNGTGAVVWVDAEEGVIRAGQVVVGGNWHFEDNLGSRNTRIELAGEIVADGHMGRCLEAKGSATDLGAYTWYQTTDGFRFSMWIKLTQAGDGVLFARENTFKLSCDADGVLKGDVSVGKQSDSVALSTRAGLLRPMVWNHVSLSYDRLAITIEVNGVVFAEKAETRAMQQDMKARLSLGGPADYRGFIDEARYVVVNAEEGEGLGADVEVAEGADLVFRFDGQGHLDARFHKGPAELLLLGPEADDGGRDQSKIRVEMTGVIR